MPDIIKDYKPSDICNMDETVLLSRPLPDKTLPIRGEKCKGRKTSKDRLTVLLCVNMDLKKL